ncbi:MAG: hypothetical protein ACOYKJ_04465 [Candidatus Howiella sp.]|jgi:hypothetical protein
MNSMQPNSGMVNFDPGVFQPASERLMQGTVNIQDFTTEFEGTGTRRLQTGELPETLANPLYIPAYLKRNIGKWVRIELLIGNSLVVRIGILKEVGASYVIIMNYPQVETMCDMYSIKFVSVINTEIPENFIGI